MHPAAFGCLRQLGPDAWALHVPIGKLHTERLVPVDADARRTLARLLQLRTLASPAQLARSERFLLPRLGRIDPLYHALRVALADAAKRATCSSPVTPHQLRHYAASGTMPRVGGRAAIHIGLSCADAA
jgi:site-specific recombinase XerC